LLFEALRNYLAQLFLSKLRNCKKFRTDAVTFKFLQHFTGQRKKIFVRKPNQKAKFVAEINIFVLLGQTVADADLTKHDFGRFAVFSIANGGNIQRKSDVLSLFY